MHTRLFGKFFDTTAKSNDKRFLDLLAKVEEDRESDPDLSERAMTGPNRPCLVGNVTWASDQPAHGPFQWTDELGNELQAAVDMFVIEEFQDLDFSVTVADPSKPDCPLVACSTGFTELTGYSIQEIVGRNCRFLLNGVPQDLVDDETRIKCRAFCETAKDGEDYVGDAEVLPDGIARSWVDLPKGELICVQTNARKTGELFRNMFYLKQVELDESMFILGLQAGLPEEFDNQASIADLERMCSLAFSRLDQNMAAIEQVLAQQFWYSAPMRRQV